MFVTNTPFLKSALRLDAIVSGAAGLLMTAGASSLAPVLGLPEGLLFYAGLVLFPFIGLLVHMSRQQSIRRLMLIDVVAINALWVAASIALLVAAPVSPNALGIAFVLAQAGAVALFAILQGAALRRAPVAA